MKKVFYLKSCSTCSRIMSGLNLDGFEQVEIKSNGISSTNLEEMKNLSGTYEALFSKRAMKYKSLGLASKSLTESDLRDYILEEYTFLKRPVFIVENDIFVGSAKSTIEALKEKIA